MDVSTRSGSICGMRSNAGISDEAQYSAPSNELLHTSLQRTTKTVIAQTFLGVVDEKDTISYIVVLIGESNSLQAVCL